MAILGNSIPVASRQNHCQWCGTQEKRENANDRHQPILQLCRSLSQHRSTQQRKFQDFRRSKLKESKRPDQWIFQGSMKLIRNTHQALWPLSPLQGNSVFKRISAEVCPLLPLMLQQNLLSLLRSLRPSIARRIAMLTKAKPSKWSMDSTTPQAAGNETTWKLL